ncbi:hypothetical protein ROL70_08480 [Cronobacter sakazakii]|uniref:hypothetical protein n=1 Tax=Cronobacter TaxID=413496 RepID=UPI000CFB2E2E|nr:MULTISPECIES: hypothetical protein [Cronobacter]MDT3585023.1 hypothetical protein [Cronobacter sakazakii]
MNAAAANKPFTAIPHDLADIEKINGKAFTMNMVYTYSLIKGYQDNGQIAYFSQDLLKRRLGVTTPTVVKLIRDMMEMGLINKTGQISGKTCHYTVNPITPEMVGSPEAAKPEAIQPEVAKPIELQIVEPVENAGTYQPGITECGSEVVHSSRTEQTRNVKLGHSGLSVQPPVISDSIREAANDDVRSNNPVVSYLPDSKVMLIDGVAVKYLEPEETDSDQYGDAF